MKKIILSLLIAISFVGAVAPSADAVVIIVHHRRHYHHPHMVWVPGHRAGHWWHRYWVPGHWVPA